MTAVNGEWLDDDSLSETEIRQRMASEGWEPAKTVSEPAPAAIDLLVLAYNENALSGNVTLMPGVKVR